MKTKGTKSKKIKLPYVDGSIYYVESRKRFAGQINLLIDGERVRKTVYGKTERETRNKLKKLQIQALAGNLHGKKPPVPTIFQYAEKMMDKQLALNEIRQSSYDRKMETLKMLSAISNKPLDELTEDDIIAFFKTQLDYSQSVSTRCISSSAQCSARQLTEKSLRTIQSRKSNVRSPTKRQSPFGH